MIMIMIMSIYILVYLQFKIKQWVSCRRWVYSSNYLKFDVIYFANVMIDGFYFCRCLLRYGDLYLYPIVSRVSDSMPEMDPRKGDLSKRTR